MTPEGRVKKAISIYLDSLREFLDTHGLDMYYTMFVPSGYGKNNSLDYTLCLCGHFVAIEAKAPGEWLTPAQRLTARSMYYSGATVFIISGPDGLAALKRWIERHKPVMLEDANSWFDR